MMTRRLTIATCLFLTVMPGAVIGSEAPGPIPALYPQKRIFQEAIALEDRPDALGRVVTGITVPHHLLAPDLIARGFRAAAQGKYRRIILLSPDHFKRAERPFAVTRRAFATPFGEVPPDAPAIDALLAACPLVGESALFGKEHGVHALLPFVAHHFPGVPVLVVALRIDTDETEWRSLADALEPLVEEDTLVVQSTDYSHYLDYRRASQHDQQTLNWLAREDPGVVLHMKQPAHVDSRAAQWVQMTLQARVHGAAPMVIAQRNSDFYAGYPQAETTSYIVQVYEKPRSHPRFPEIRTEAWPPYPGDEVLFFAGDTFLGRYLGRRLARPEIAERVAEAVLKVTGGAPLIVNLEGVMLAEYGMQVREWPLGMDREFTLGWLRKLNVRAVSLANNHALDYGPAALSQMRADLAAAGITSVGHGEVLDLGRFRLLALSDLCNSRTPPHFRITRAEVQEIASRELALPMLAFMHWGREFETEPGAREDELAQWLHEASVNLVIGAHPHQARMRAGEALKAGNRGGTLQAYSLGNFLFDQRADRASGALLEVRFFKDGPHAVRWHPLGNLYDPVIPPGRGAPSNPPTGQ